MVRSFDFLCQRHLAADASDRFSAGKTVSFLEAHDLCFAVGGDHNDCIYSLVDTNFEEERYVIDHHCFGIASCRLSCESGLFARDAGVNDSFELAQFGFVTEDDCTECAAIDGPVRVQYVPPECLHDLSPGRFAWLDDVPRRLIGIDDDGAALLEHLGNGAFACGDAACEADQQHGCGA